MASRQQYENFLARFGLSTCHVEPLLSGSQQGQVKDLWGKHKGRLSPADRALMSQWIEMVDANCNAILDMIQVRIRKRAKELELSLPCDTYAGVFPTFSFNAQSRLEGDGALVLLDMGCLALIEAITLVWAWNTDSLKNNRAACRFVTGYVEDYKLPSAQEYDHPSLHDGVRMLAFSELLTKAEEFVVAHEFAHLILRHVQSAPQQAFATPAGEVALVVKNWEQELNADRLALTLVQPNQPNSLSLRQSCAAPYIAFGVAHLVETAFELFRPHERPNNDTHPPAIHRQTALKNAISNISPGSASDLGEKFWVFVKDCVTLLRMKQHGVEVED